MKFRKKPVVIEAIQVKEDNDLEIMKFMGVTSLTCRDLSDDPDEPAVAIMIETPDGDMAASVGDWIIKGLKGEFYPCKPDIFNMSYDEVVEHPCPMCDDTRKVHVVGDDHGHYGFETDCICKQWRKQ